MADVEVNIRTTYDGSGAKKAMSDVDAYQAKIKSLEKNTISGLLSAIQPQDAKMFD